MIKNTAFSCLVLLAFSSVISAADITSKNWWDVVAYEGSDREGYPMFSYDQEVWNTFEQGVIAFNCSRKKEVREDLLVKINASKILLFPRTVQLNSNDIPSIAMELKKPDGTPVQENGIFYTKLIKPSQDFVKKGHGNSEESPLIRRALSCSNN